MTDPEKPLWTTEFYEITHGFLEVRRRGSLLYMIKMSKTLQDFLIFF